VTTSTTETRRVALQSSAPQNSTTWRAVGIVVATLQTGQTMSVTPWAICTT
jgi:hypothetical protein